MAEYDLPATVDKILSITGAQQIYYVGHSQGCEIAFAQLSRDAELANKIKLFVGLAPATYLGHMKSPIRLLAPYAKDLEVNVLCLYCIMLFLLLLFLLLLLLLLLLLFWIFAIDWFCINSIVLNSKNIAYRLSLDGSIWIKLLLCFVVCS